jgi:hypothetical protein
MTEFDTGRIAAINDRYTNKDLTDQLINSKIAKSTTENLPMISRFYIIHKMESDNWELAVVQVIRQEEGCHDFPWPYHWLVFTNHRLIPIESSAVDYFINIEDGMDFEWASRIFANSEEYKIFAYDEIERVTPLEFNNDVDALNEAIQYENSKKEPTNE